MLMSIYVIAEIGINHNGSIEIAKQLIDVAVDAGADAVKFQKRTIDLVYTQEMLAAPRQSPWGLTQREQKEGLELSEEDYWTINDYCSEKGIDWFASAWDIESQRFLRQFQCKKNKIASAMIVYQPLLKMVAEEGKHTYISTGMSKASDIDKAVEIFQKNNCSFELMHCVSTYPMSDEDANLRRIESLRKKYQCNVGYSGHEVGLSVSFAAASLGISSLERHITLDRAMYGSDQSASIEPAGFKMLLGGVRKIEKALGDGRLDMNPKEVGVAEKLRAHIQLESNGC